MDLDTVLRDLDEEEPNVIVEPEIGAFCMLRRAAPPKPAQKRVSLEAILAFMANPF